MADVEVVEKKLSACAVADVEVPVVKKLTAKELRVIEREKAAAEAKAATAATNASSDTYGISPLTQSQGISGRVWTK